MVCNTWNTSSIQPDYKRSFVRTELRPVRTNSRVEAKSHLFEAHLYPTEFEMVLPVFFMVVSCSKY